LISAAEGYGFETRWKGGEHNGPEQKDISQSRQGFVESFARSATRQTVEDRCRIGALSTTKQEKRTLIRSFPSEIGRDYQATPRNVP
jgi:hypothetical protein